MSGMTITSSDLLEIIKTCADSGVSSLLIGEVNLKFYNTKHHNQTKNIALPQDDASSLSDSLSQSEIDSEIEHVDQTVNDEYLAQLSIIDPLGYEDYTLKKLMEEGN